MSDHPPSLYDAAGLPLPTRIELVEASGPVSPRFAYATTVVIEASPDVAPRVVRDHRDASGTHHDERALSREAYETLVGTLLTTLPLGTILDLAADKRDRKGVSFNHLSIKVGDSSARLDYLLSDVDEDDGDPRARAVVGALKASAPPM